MGLGCPQISAQQNGDGISAVRQVPMSDMNSYNVTMLEPLNHQRKVEGLSLQRELFSSVVHGWLLCEKLGLNCSPSHMRQWKVVGPYPNESWSQNGSPRSSFKIDASRTPDGLHLLSKPHVSQILVDRAKVLLVKETPPRGELHSCLEAAGRS